MPCGRLSWLLVCFWAHIKIVISYHIISLFNFSCLFAITSLICCEITKVEILHFSFQSCCIPCLENDTVLACYIFDIHQPILIFFVDNKVVLLSTVCKYYFLPSHFCVTTLLSKANRPTVRQSPGFVLPQVCRDISYELRGGITNHHLIAYSLSNSSAKNYQNRLMCI